MMVADAAIGGHLYIISMLRRAVSKVRSTADVDTIDRIVSGMPIALRASRRMLTTANVLLEAEPLIETVSLLFDVSQMHMPYTYVARNFLDATDISPLVDDATLLRDVTQHLETLAQDSVEVRPLARALRRTQMQVQRKLEGNI